MSIIIRLQHLPWSASAADIRQFFSNLTIPDGGVHIVGGENGDVFIAFGSDEDARQAMLMDGGTIKDAKVKLLLSSRTEMQKVIELARQQALTLQNLMQTMAAATAAGTFGTNPISMSMLPNMLSSFSTLQQNMPSATIPLMGTLTGAASSDADNKVSVPAATAVFPTVMPGTQLPPKQDERTGRASTATDGKRRVSASSSRSRSASRSKSKSRSRSRSRDRRSHRSDRYRHRNRSRDRKWRRDRSKSKDHDRYGSKRRSRSRDRKGGRDQNKSRDKKRDHDKKEKSPVTGAAGGRRNSQEAGGGGRFRPIPEQEQQQSQQAEDPKNGNFKMSFNSRPKSGNVGQLPRYASKDQTADEPATGGEIAAKSSDLLNLDMLTVGGGGAAVPMPPMMPAWLLNQQNDKSNTTDTEKSASSKEEQTEKTAPASAALPYGMYSTQFPFAPQGFASAAAAGMYPFAAGYTANAAANFPMTPMGIPPFYNPFSTIASATSTTTTPATNHVQQQSPQQDQSPPQDQQQKVSTLKGVGDEPKHHTENNYSNYSSQHSSEDDRKSKFGYSSYDAAGGKGEGYSNRNTYNGEETNGVGGGKHNRNYDTYGRKNYSSEKTDANRHEYGRDEWRKRGADTPLYPRSTCVELRNVPRAGTANEIKKFFYPLPLHDSCIKFLPDGRGNREGVVYVKFVNENVKLQALRYSGKSINGFRIHVVEMDETVWEKAVEGDSNVAASSLQLYLKISFIPKTTRRRDVLAAFKDAPDDCFLLRDTKNKDNFVAYLKFANSPSAKNALNEKYKFMVGGSRVRLESIGEEEFLIGKTEYQLSDDNLECNDNGEKDSPQQNHYSETRRRRRWGDAAAEEDKPATATNGGAGNGVGSAAAKTPKYNDNQVEEYVPRSKKLDSTCILLRNLPHEVRDKEVVSFFTDLNVVPREIHIMFDANGRPTGNTYCEFADEEAAAKALKKDRSFLRDNVVSVTMVPKAEVDSMVGASMSSPPSEFHHRGTNYRGGGGGGGAAAVVLTAADTDAAPTTTPEFGRPSRPPFMGGRAPAPASGPPPRRPGLPAERFGRPGCVVALENVPYKAGPEEIIEFFGDFNVMREHVIRRFNENGQATGDARVCLRNPVEARDAVRCLDGGQIRDRTIYVSLLN